MMVLLSMQLTTLDLADNNITDDGVASLSEALKQSTCQLTKLYIDGIQITDDGVAVNATNHIRSGW